MKLRLKLKMRGLSPAHYDLALRLNDAGYDVELSEGVSMGFVRKAPLSRARCLRIAQLLRIDGKAFLDLIFATPVKRFSVQGRRAQPFVDTHKVWVCEETLRTLLRGEWLRRGFAIDESSHRFDPIQSTRMGNQDLTLHNSRGEALKTVGSVDGERTARWFSKTYLFSRLEGWEEALDLRFLGQTRILTNAARVGTEVFVLAPNRTAIQEFESRLGDRKLSAKHPHFALFEKLRTHWVAGASGSFQHQERSYDVAPKFPARGPVLSWGDSVGELAPLFNGSLECEFDEADAILRSFKYIDIKDSIDVPRTLATLQVQIRNLYGENARQLSFWEFVLKDPLLGRGLNAVLSLTPSVTRSWLQLPF